MSCCNVQAVSLRNEDIAVVIVCGGGHIAAIHALKDHERMLGARKRFAPRQGCRISPTCVAAGVGGRAGDDFGSPLWIPPWPTCDPAAAGLADEETFGRPAPA